MRNNINTNIKIRFIIKLCWKTVVLKIIVIINFITAKFFLIWKIKILVRNYPQ